jgi:ATP-dependent Clp protease ATP-binding subunit ClpC
VVLLDEIEKAHPDVFSILLQVLDDGVLTDSARRRVDFKNTVIIMTSNLGARQIMGGKQLGFKMAGGEKSAFATMKSTVTDELKRTFNPEFLNRIDDVIVFRALTREDMQRIVAILLGQLKERLSGQSIYIDISTEAMELLIDKGFDPSLGARPLKRAIQRLLEDPLSEYILRGEIPTGVRVGVERSEDQLRFVSPEKPAGAAVPSAQP